MIQIQNENHDRNVYWNRGNIGKNLASIPCELSSVSSKYDSITSTVWEIEQPVLIGIKQGVLRLEHIADFAKTAKFIVIKISKKHSNWKWNTQKDKLNLKDMEYIRKLKGYLKNVMLWTKHWK